MSHSSLDQSAWNRVAISIACTARKESNVMSLSSDNDGELGCWSLWVDVSEHLLHVCHFLVQHELKLLWLDFAICVEQLRLTWPSDTPSRM